MTMTIEDRAYISFTNSLRRQVLAHFDEYVEGNIDLPSAQGFIVFLTAAEEVENEEIAEMKRETELTLRRDL